MPSPIWLAAAVVSISMLGQTGLQAQPMPMPTSTYASTSPPNSSASPTPVPTQTPSPVPTPSPSPSPVPSPKIVFWAAAFGSAYGVYQAGEPIIINASISARPPVTFPYLDGGIRGNVDLHITDERGRVVAPTRPHALNASPRIITGYGINSDAAPLSDWGYDPLRPGSYHVTPSLKAATSDWASAHGYTVEIQFSADIRIVSSYSDLDPHLFPPPAGWAIGGCVLLISNGRPTGEALLRGKKEPGGEQCFRVYLSKQTFNSGLVQQRLRARSADATVFSEKDVKCGSELATVFTYRVNVVPAQHVESVLMKTRAGYIVALYERPDAAPDDPAVIEALGAPCLIL